MTPKFPNVVVQLSGEDGNAFTILGKVRKQMTKHRISVEEITSYVDNATSGDYNHLLKVTQETVTVE